MPEDPALSLPEPPPPAAGAPAGGQPVLDALPDPFLLLRPERGVAGTITDFICTYANGEACRLHGHQPERIVGARLRDLHPSHCAGDLFEHGLRAFEAGQTVAVPAPGRPGEAPGAPRALRLFPAGGWLCCLWSGASEPADLRRRLSELERRHHLLAGHASDLVIEVDADHRILWVSESVQKLLGWSPPALVGRPAMAFVHSDDRCRALRTGLGPRDRGRFEGELRIRRADDGWCSMGGSVRPAPEGSGGAWVLCLRDIQDRVTIRAELDHSQHHDTVTGLAVRHVALGRIREALDRQAGTGSMLAVLSIGVDGLTPVNDALTHAGGDQLIAFLAGRIVRAIGEPDRVGRGTGDEFIVLLSDLASAAEAAHRAERILTACRAPITIGGQPIDPTVSIGIATSAAGALPDELLRDASLAMRQAKARGRNCFALLDDALATEAHTRLLFAAEIQRGLVMEEFAAWFMPIVCFETGEVTGYEALARWVRPDGIEVGPAEFLPCAERRGLIVRIDRLVLRQALVTLSRLPDELTMAVNVSAATLAQPDHPQLVAEALEAAGVSPERLHLEVTETALVTVTERIRQQIQQLAGRGIRWYVDDFGTGYSSISHLRDLPIAGLKLDRSFTSAMRAKDTKTLRLSQALVGVAEGLELDTVAEGVETIEEARLLTSQGWLHGQGWFYGKAAPLEP
ncbi:putative bifunctional diguanylate cyclase/phosphodiesterase [Cyanobium gracile]|nr:bifunctional diguanylate cyclase/phosphodiesterase [Cyanobium gracile]